MQPLAQQVGDLERQVVPSLCTFSCRGLGWFLQYLLGQRCLGLDIALNGDTLGRWALLLRYKGCCFPRYRLCFVCEAGPHLLELGSGNAEDRRHESVVSCCEGHMPAVGHAHGAALRRTAALYESAAKVRVLFCLQGWGGENGGRQSSQGAVPREGVLRMPVLLQLKKTKKSGGKGVRQRLNSPLVCAVHAVEIFTGRGQILWFMRGVGFT